jgi:hypothetical protein
VAQEGDRGVLQGPGFAFPLPNARLQGQALVAGVRPQTLRLVEAGAVATPMLQLQVDVVEYLGMESCWWASWSVRVKDG